MAVAKRDLLDTPPRETDDTVQVPEMPVPSERGVSIMVSYRELVEIRAQIATLTGMLQAALAMQGQVTRLDKRLAVVENILAGRSGERKTWNTIAAYLGGVVTTALGGGALMYLPKLWGG